MEEYYLKLTLALYKVSERFPEKEPLRYSLREKGNEVLAGLILGFSNNPFKAKSEQERQAIFSQVLGDIEIIQGYLRIIKEQGWTNELNIAILSQEYKRLESQLGQEIKGEQRNEAPKLKEQVLIKNKQEKQGNNPAFQNSIDKLKNGRQKKILSILKNKEALQVKDIQGTFPKMSKRTLRRDFEYLTGQGFVKRIGEGNSTVYKLNRTLAQAL